MRRATRRTRATTPEGLVVSACLHYFAARGIEAWRNNTGATKAAGKNGTTRFIRFGKKGSSDILGCLDPYGIMIAVECKTDDPRSKPMPDQLAFLERIRRCGGFAVVVKSIDELHSALEIFRASKRKELYGHAGTD